MTSVASEKPYGIAFSVSRVIGVVIRYAFAGLLVLLGNTLQGLLPGRASALYFLILLVCTIAICSKWMIFPLSKKEMTTWFIWATVITVAYSTVFFATGDGRGLYGLCSTGFLVLCPLLVLLLIKAGELGSYLRAFVNLVAVLAVFSLVLWIAGPVTGSISTNCTISNSWTGTGARIQSAGYFNLLYITQRSGLLGFSIIRNTGIFAEAPMYSYILCMALLFELFFSRKFRVSVVALLCLTILTTLSTTGIVFVLGTLYVEVIYKTRAMKSRLRPVLLIVLAAVLIGIASVSLSLIDQKMGTSSGNIRLDDFHAGYLAWRESPVVGYGLGNSDALTLFMSGFRSTNQGFSNSVFDLLVRGGLVFATPFLLAALGFLSLPIRLKTAAALFMYLWIITIVTFLPLTYFMFSFGVVGLMNGADGFDAESLRMGDLPC